MLGKHDTVSEVVTACNDARGYAQRRVELSRDDVVVEDLLPPLMHGSLAVADKAHALLHYRTDVDMVGVSGVGGDEADAAALPDGHDHLVDDLGHVRLEHERLLYLVQQRLGLVERAAVERDVEAARADLLQTLDDVSVLGEVERLDARLALRERNSLGHAVDADDALRALELRPLGNALADGTQALRDGVSARGGRRGGNGVRTQTPTVSPSLMPVSMTQW